MLASLVVYVVVVELISRAMPAPLGNSNELLRYVFYAIGFMSLALANVMRALMLRQMPSDLDGALQRLVQIHIIVGAISEVPALLGMVLFFVQRTTTDFYLLSLVSLYLFLRHLPRMSSWESTIARVTQANG